MAFLDLGLIEYFSIIFPALLVFAIVYALLEKFKIIGDSKSIHAIIAIVLAFITILLRDVTKIINFIAPWFVLLFIFVLLILIVYKIMGASDADLSSFIKTHTLTQWIIVLIGIVIIVAGIASVYGQRLKPITDDEGNVIDVSSDTSTESDEFEESVGKTLFHPKVVGLIFIFLVAAFSIGLLTQKELIN